MNHQPSSHPVLLSVSVPRSPSKQVGVSSASDILQIVAPGVASSIRGSGRTGLAHLGSGRRGAVDLRALQLVNRLLGNPPDAAAIETSGGLSVRLTRSCIIAVTGSQAALDVTGGPPLGWGIPTALPAGSLIRVGRLVDGVRTYLGVRGGIVHPAPLLAAGTTLGSGPEPVGPPSAIAAVPGITDNVIDLWPGPRLDWFSETALDRLVSTLWRVRLESDRVGVRLEGPRLERLDHRDLPSEGLIEGSIQVPPDGQPIVMLADHPTTGGYPVVAVVDPVHVGLVAQRQPGEVVRFRWVARHRSGG